MENNLKEVRFDIYCKKCKHQKLNESKDPCNECLDHGWNDETEKPVNYVPQDRYK